MSAEIVVAIVSGCFTFLGVVVTVIVGNKKASENVKKQTKEQTEVTLYRIDQLEKKVELHNNAVERLYIVERKLEVDEEKIRVANNRIKDLEQGG